MSCTIGLRKTENVSYTNFYTIGVIICPVRSDCGRS